MNKILTGEWWAIKIDAPIKEFGWETGEHHVGLVIGDVGLSNVFIVYFPSGDGVRNIQALQFEEMLGEVQDLSWKQADERLEDWLNG